MKNGWNSQDNKTFGELLVKANDQQLSVAIRAIKDEINSRYGREWAAIEALEREAEEEE